MILIFDLDQTLVDSSSIEHLRVPGGWKSAVQAINAGEVMPYAGVPAMLAFASQARFVTALVTSSPSHYAKAVLDYHRWVFDAVVCYHDTWKHKPHPEPIAKAMQLLAGSHAPGAAAVSFGDRAIDIVASRAAGAVAVACLWGSSESDELLGCDPDHTIGEVGEIEALLEALCRQQTR